MKATDWYGFYGRDCATRKKKKVHVKVRAGEVAEVVQAGSEIFLHTRLGNVYQVDCPPEDSNAVYDQIVEFLTILWP